MPLWKTQDSPAGRPKSLMVGQVLAINYTGTGTGYTSGSFTISAPPAGGVQAVATYTASGGTITGVTITNPGSGYTTAPTISTAGGSGLTITSVIKPINKVDVPKTPNTVNAIVFVDPTEVVLASNRAKGFKTPGWYKYFEYTQNDGATRAKSQCIVAVSNAAAAGAGDGADDAIVADVAFSITTNPSNSTVTAPAAASFTVVSAGATSFQWQVRTGGAGQYTNITNGGVYTNATTATLNISNSTGLNGNRYRCQVFNSTNNAAATSTAALLTVN